MILAHSLIKLAEQESRNNLPSTTITTTTTAVTANKCSYRCGEKSLSPVGDHDDTRLRHFLCSIGHHRHCCYHHCWRHLPAADPAAAVIVAIAAAATTASVSAATAAIPTRKPSSSTFFFPHGDSWLYWLPHLSRIVLDLWNLANMFSIVCLGSSLLLSIPFQKSSISCLP